MSESKPIVYYWGGVKSRTFYMGMALACTGNSDNVTFSGNDTAGNPIPYPGTPEWAALPEDTLSAWKLLPKLVDEASGTAVGESGAISRWLIKKFGLAPDDLKLYAISEQNIETSAAIHAHFNGAQYAPNRTEAMDALFSEGSRLQKTLAGIEKTFEEGSVFVGSEATVGDYFLAAGLMQAALLQPDSLDAYPKCKALHDHVHTMDGAKAYLATVPYSYFKRNSD